MTYLLGQNSLNEVFGNSKSTGCFWCVIEDVGHVF